MSIREINWDDEFPVYDTELHLVRCNYQSQAVAFKLANDGKFFGGLYGWSTEEINLASAITAFRSERSLSRDQVAALVNYYPLKMFGIKGSKENLISNLNETYAPQLNTGNGILKTAVDRMFTQQ